MSTTYKDEFIIDVSKVGLIKETEDYITTRFDVRLIFGEIVVEDGKQWLEIQGDEDKRSLAKVYICNLCNPVETAEIEYPVELQEMLTDRELCYNVEHQTGVSLHFVRSGLISIGGSDPVSVTMAYSMLEDIISHNWDKTQEGASSRPKQASKRLDAELRRLSSQNKLDLECDISLQNDVIKRTILDVLWKTDQSSSSQASFEEFGITPHQSQGSSGTDSSNNMCLEKPNTSRYLYGAAEQLKKIDLKENAKISSDGSGRDEPGKYLKKFALDRGHSEEKIEDIFAVYGRNVKFDVFFRALNGLIEVPKEKRASPMKSANASTTAVTDCCVTKDKDLSPADSAVATYMSRLSKDHEEEDSILNVEELKKRNAERQQLLLDALSKRSNSHSDCVVNTSAAVVASEQTVTIDLTMDNSSDETDSCHRHTAHPQHNRVTRSRSPLNKAVLNGHGPPQQSALLSNGGAAASTVNPSLLRHIVIDGSNVAMTHGNGKVFSCRGIDIVVKYFVKRGHKDVTVFVPQWRTRTQSLDYKISDQHLLDTLKQQGYLVFTPSRRIQGKNIVCYDDRYVIRLAQEVDGVIVSNDNYRDLWRECPDWREVIENRLLMYSFVGDLFMPPDDPLGRHGPSLTEFLQKSVAHTKTRQHRPMNSQAFHGKSAPQGIQPHQMHQMPTQLIPAYIQPMLNNHVQNVARPWSNVVPVNSLIGAPLVYHNPSTSFNSANGSNVSGPNTANVTRSNNPCTQPTTHQTNEWKQVPQKRWKQHSSKGRDESVTRTLYQSLQEVFRNCDEAIRHVLEDNPAETDLNTLSEYMLNYMSNN